MVWAEMRGAAELCWRRLFRWSCKSNYQFMLLRVLCEMENILFIFSLSPRATTAAASRCERVLRRKTFAQNVISGARAQRHYRNWANNLLRSLWIEISVVRAACSSAESARSVWVLRCFICHFCLSSFASSSEMITRRPWWWRRSYQVNISQRSHSRRSRWSNCETLIAATLRTHILLSLCVLRGGESLFLYFSWHGGPPGRKRAMRSL